MPVKKSSAKKAATKKVAEKKITVKEVKTEVAPKATVKPTTRRVNLSVPVFSLLGKDTGTTLTLPKKVFGQKVNKSLLSQAIRVYSTNQKVISGSTKTRGEVAGSTAKIFRQKGTGRARHGSVRAPIFVGGGIVFGPRPRKVRLTLPQKMKRAALISALSSKVLDKNIFGLSGMEKSTGKTKEIVKLMLSVGQSAGKKKKSMGALIVTGGKSDNVFRSVRNIKGITALPANLLNAYAVLKHEILLISKEAVEVLGKVEKEVK